MKRRRNGGQELTVRSIQAALMCQDMIVVGDRQPSARIGATLWNQNDSIAADEFGIGTAKSLGRRVAEVASRMWQVVELVHSKPCRQYAGPLFGMKRRFDKETGK